MRLFLILLIFSICLYSLELVGKVVAVADGDTITLLTKENKQYKIRLNDIDAPEKKQAFGNKSKENLSNYVFGKNVRVEYKKSDRYKRILGTIYLNDLDINLQQVKDGFAWHYKQYSKKKHYAEAEDLAQKDKKGLWAEKNPQAPWEFRKNKKKKSSS